MANDLINKKDERSCEWQMMWLTSQQGGKDRRLEKTEVLTWCPVRNRTTYKALSSKNSKCFLWSLGRTANLCNAYMPSSLVLELESSGQSQLFHLNFMRFSFVTFKMDTVIHLSQCGYKIQWSVAAGRMHGSEQVFGRCAKSLFPTHSRGAGLV